MNRKGPADAASATRRLRGVPSGGKTQTGDTPCRLAVAARPALFCEVLSLKLHEEPDLEVAGVARDEDEARALLAREHPQVLVFDYEGLGPGSEAAVRRLRRVARGTRILVLATRSSQETLERMLRAGAAGLVGKQQTFETLVRAIRAVARGELWANRAAAAQVVEDLTGPSRSSTFDVRLTAREREIVQAVGLGGRNRDIGDRLHISEKTVKSHLNSIFRKLQVDNRFAAGLYSIDGRRESGTS